jgi:hypothetical protein
MKKRKRNNLISAINDGANGRKNTSSALQGGDFGNEKNMFI